MTIKDCVTNEFCRIIGIETGLLIDEKLKTKAKKHIDGVYYNSFWGMLMDVGRVIESDVAYKNVTYMFCNKKAVMHYFGSIGLTIVERKYL